MNLINKTKFLKTATLTLLVIGSLNTQAKTADTSKTNERVGFGSGVAIGAALGGPPGAIIGAVLGALTGNQLDEKNQQEKQLTQLSTEFHSIEQALEVAKNSKQKTHQLMLAHQMFVQKLASELTVNLMFRTNSTELESSTADKINPIVSLMYSFPELVLQLQGFADVKGSEVDNMQLSQKRAEAVKNRLVRSGINPERIKIQALGETLAKANVTDNEGKALDRHVVIGFVTETTKNAVAIRAEY